MKTLTKLSLLLVLMLAVATSWIVAQERPSEGARAGKTTQKLEDNKSKDPLENMKFRNLGPAVGGGRVSAVVGVPGKPNIYYAGAGGGGVFMTQDGGLSWKPIFEKESTASIGA